MIKTVNKKRRICTGDSNKSMGTNGPEMSCFLNGERKNKYKRKSQNCVKGKKETQREKR